MNRKQREENTRTKHGGFASPPHYFADITPSDSRLFRSWQHFCEGKKFIYCKDFETDISCFFTQLPDETLPSYLLC